MISKTASLTFILVGVIFHSGLGAPKSKGECIKSHAMKNSQEVEFVEKCMKKFDITEPPSFEKLKESRSSLTDKTGKVLSLNIIKFTFTKSLISNPDFDWFFSVFFSMSWGT